MMGHQRDILASLGIDIWVSRMAVSQTLPQSSVWRDQAAPEIHSEIIVPAAVPQQLKQQQPIIHEKPKQEPSPQHTTVEAAAPEVVPEARVMLQIEAFSIEALQLPHCVTLHPCVTQECLKGNVLESMVDFLYIFHTDQGAFSWITCSGSKVVKK